MNRFRAWIISAAVGALTGVGTYLVSGPYVSLSVTCFILYTLGMRLMLLHSDVFFTRNSDWVIARWGGVGGGLLGAVPLFGVSTALPLSSSLRFSLSVLVLGAMTTMWALGVAHARETASNSGLDIVAESA